MDGTCGVLVARQLKSTFDLKLGYVALELRRASSGGSDSPSPPHAPALKSKHLRRRSMSSAFSLLFPLDPPCLGRSACPISISRTPPRLCELGKDIVRRKCLISEHTKNRVLCRRMNYCSYHALRAFCWGWAEKWLEVGRAATTEEP
jgi:hypothetical protein